MLKKIIIDNILDKKYFEIFAKEIQFTNYEIIEEYDNNSDCKIYISCLPTNKKQIAKENIIDISEIYKDYENFAAAFNNNKTNLIIKFKKFMNEKGIKLNPYYPNLFDYYKDLYDKDINNINELKTGFNLLDEKIKNVNSQLYTICGETNVGKTAFALQIALQLVLNDPDIKIYYYTVEHEEITIIDRIIALLSKKDSNPIELDKIKSKQEKESSDKLLNKYEEVVKRFTIISDTNITASQIYTDAKYYSEQNSKIVIFIDYLQMLRQIKNENTEYDKINETIKSLKNTIFKFHYPIFVISSLSRNSNDLTIKRLNGSHKIEYSSETILELIEKENGIILKCEKNKNGKKFKLKYKFLQDYQYFEEVIDTKKRKEERIEI